jgi:hypothetical protein
MNSPALAYLSSLKPLFLAVFLILVSCNSDAEKEITSSAVNVSKSADGNSSNDLPDITFNEDEFDFGKIIQGEKVSHAFFFRNTGKKNLIISSASGSCGCTVPEWPKEPILPGQSAKIDVIFSSDGKSGYQEKTVTVVTNCEPATRVIRIKCEIIVAETAR